MKRTHESKWIKTLAVMFFAMTIAGLLYSAPAHAKKIKTVGGTVSDTNRPIYRGYYYKAVNSYLFKEEENLMRVEFIYEDDEDKGDLAVEIYNKSYKLLSKKIISLKNKLFGGFYPSADAYYVLLGYYNPKEDDKRTVYQVVRYDKNWKVQGQCNINNTGTYTPFSAGSARMAMYKNQLFVHTCHLMYKSEDGLHHQSNIMFQINTDTMKGNANPAGVEQYRGIYDRYTSHSFNQFVTVDQDKLVTLDHGDAYPRSLILRKGPISINPNEYYYDDEIEEAELIKFPGKTGENYTDATAGSLEISKNNYVVSGVYKKNIYIATVPRNQVNNQKVHFKYITNYSSKYFNEDRETEYEATHLVKLSDTQFMLLWQEESGKVRYVKIDENGNKLTSILTTTGELSYCKPIVYNGKVLWYYCKDSSPVFCYPLERPSHIGKIKGTVAYNKALSTAKINKPVVKDSKGKILAGEWKWSKPDKIVTSKDWYYPKLKFIPKDTAHYDIIEGEYAELKVTGFNKKKMATKDHVIYQVISKKKKTARAIGCTKASATSLTIQNQIKINGKYYKVTEVKSYAFLGHKKVKKVVMGKNVKKIGVKAFYGCTSLVNINIKSTGIKKSKLGNLAFSKIGKSAKVKVPKKKKRQYKKIFKKKYGLKVS